MVAVRSDESARPREPAWIAGVSLFPRLPWSDDARVALRPAAVYDELSRGPARTAFLERPLLFSFLLGLVLALTTAGRPTLRLVLGGALAFGFIPALQIASIALSGAAFGRSGIPLLRAIDLHFLGYLPWTVWLLFVAAFASFTSPEREHLLWAVILWSVAVPILWSRVIGWHFFRRVLGMGVPGALAALLVQIAIVWGSILVFFLFSGQLEPRILSGH